MPPSCGSWPRERPSRSTFGRNTTSLPEFRDDEVSGGGGNLTYTHCLKKIDRNFPQYIHDNTDDEISHQNFLNAYLASKGAQTADLEQFRMLPGSFATGSSGKLRLTNLMHQRWIPAGGHATAAAPTIQMSIPRPSRKQFRICT